VAVFNGRFPVKSAQVRFTASHSVLGNGALAQMVVMAASGIAQAEWTLDRNVPDQHVTAQLLEGGKAAVAQGAGCARRTARAAAWGRRQNIV
jgi:hypothetical protein